MTMQVIDLTTDAPASTADKASAEAPRMASKRARQNVTARQKPPQHAEQPQHAGLQQGAHTGQRPQQAQQAGSAASSIPNIAPLERSLHSESAAPARAAAPAADLAAMPLVMDPISGPLALLRSNKFEGLAVLSPDELPAAGYDFCHRMFAAITTPLCLLIHVVLITCTLGLHTCSSFGKAPGDSQRAVRLTTRISTLLSHLVLPLALRKAVSSILRIIQCEPSSCME